MLLLILILVILFGLGGIPAWRYGEGGYRGGYFGGGGLLLVILIVVILATYGGHL